VSGVDRLQYLSWLLYLIGFVQVLRRTLQRLAPAHIDMRMFFGAVVASVLMNVASRLGLVVPIWLSNGVGAALRLSVGYLLMRLVGDFTPVPEVLLRAVEIGLLVSIVAVWVLPSPLPLVIVAAIVAYLCFVIGYDARAFIQQARRTMGVTWRRMQAAATASICTILVLVAAGTNGAAPNRGTAM
jgi:hypothetical protein